MSKSLIVGVILLGLLACSAPEPTVVAFDLVLLGGRVVDPASGVDGTFSVGISDGRIAAVSADTLSGNEVVDASGLVISPGFIDLHAHGQDPVSQRLQVRDGVTTALDLEIGAYPIASWLATLEGRALIHFGASVGHVPARAARFDGLELGHTPTLDPTERAAASSTRYAYAEPEDEDIDAILGLLDTGLAEGGLGFGLGLAYTPGASRGEILRVFELAAQRGVPVSVHLRGEGSGGTIGAFQEVIANAAATGAALHIVHINSSSGDLARTTLGMVRGARERGVDVTTEAYPYTAGSTMIQSALFDSWESLPAEEYARLQWPLTGERLTPETFREYRQRGGWVIMHGRSEELNEWLTAQPDVMVASDGIPFLHGPAHPRGAGTFSRVLGHYARDRGALDLTDAIAKMTIQPARRLEGISPQMARKGRLSVGADADITVFDPEAVIDRATYEDGDRPSEGIVHVLVGGTFVVRDAEVVEGVFPGQAIRSGST